jgi:hypothetical protein
MGLTKEEAWREIELEKKAHQEEIEKKTIELKKKWDAGQEQHDLEIARKYEELNKKHAAEVAAHQGKGKEVMIFF